MVFEFCLNFLLCKTKDYRAGDIALALHVLGLGLDSQKNNQLHGL
jgi:hypothetical protein